MKANTDPMYGASISTLETYESIFVFESFFALSH